MNTKFFIPTMTAFCLALAVGLMPVQTVPASAAAPQGSVGGAIFIADDDDDGINWADWEGTCDRNLQRCIYRCDDEVFGQLEEIECEDACYKEVNRCVGYR